MRLTDMSHQQDIGRAPLVARAFDREAGEESPREESRRHRRRRDFSRGVALARARRGLGGGVERSVYDRV